MKLRYLFAAIASSLCVFAACTQDEPVSLETIQLDKTYLVIPPAGGDATLKVKSTVPWALAENIVIGKDADKKDIKAQLPTWLTATAVSGEAGEKDVTFHADACDYGREQLFQIEVGKQLQYFIVRQGEMTIEETSIADALAAPDGKSFRLTGVVTEKYNNYEKYGNFYISDGKDKILIYGIADKDGKFGNNPIASWGIEIGDELTLEGPRGNYNGSPQMVNCTVIKLVKALLQIDASSFDIPKEGDDIVVTASFKGNGVMIKSAPDWISLSSTEYVAGVPSKLEPNPADKNILTFHVAPNDGVKPRTGEIVLASTAGKNTSEQTVTVTQAPNAPELMTIAEALQTDYVHIKGTVMAICTRGYVLADATGAILCYYGSKFDATQYKIGDVIEVVHGISAYNYGPQLSCDGEGKAFDLEEKISEGTGEVTYPTPSVIGPDELEDLVASISGKDGKKVSDAIKMEYVQISGTPIKSGNYINIFVDGYDAADFSAYNLPASFDLNAMLDKKVTVRGYTQSISGTKHVNIVFTEMIEGEAEVPTIEYTDLSTINALAAGSDFELTAIVAALKGTDAAIVTDGTNFFYLYKPTTMPEVGDVVTAKGKTSVYRKLIESAQGPEVTIVQKGTVPDLTPKDITATFGSFLNTDQPTGLISATGQYVVDGTFTNLVVGENTVKGSLSGEIDAAYNGKTVKVTGWYTGSNSSSSFIYMIVTKIEEVS